MIVTFYSFKGGVGRSMALVNVAEILASWGYRVVLCDWDLEAPGLERYLVKGDRGDEIYKQEVTAYLARDGLMDMLLQYKEVLAKPAPDSPQPATENLAQGAPDIDPQYQPLGKVLLRRPLSYTYLVPGVTPRRGAGWVRLLTAGRRDGEENQKHYAEIVRQFDWDNFYEKWAGGAYLEFFRTDLDSSSCDFVLIDSRTGVTEQGGVCTHHLADLVVLLSAANEMNVDGTRWMVRVLSDPRLATLRSGRPLKVLPVASRIEWGAQKEELRDFENRFRREFRDYIPDSIGDPESFLLKSEIPYIPFYSFKERVVAREVEDRRDPRLYDAYSTLADAIVRHGVSSGKVAQLKSDGGVRVATAESVARTDLPTGAVFIGCGLGDEQIAITIAAGLRSIGVSVDPEGMGNQRGWQSIKEAAGCVVVVGRNGIDAAQRAELDYILRRQVLRRSLRVVPVVLPADEASRPANPLLARFRALSAPPDIGPSRKDFFRNLGSELAAAPTNTASTAETDVCLGPFNETDARFFFGRDRDIEKILTALAQKSPPCRWVQIEGPTGCGKTSLVRAGLLPAARAGWVSGISRGCIVAVCHLAADPISDLFNALRLGDLSSSKLGSDSSSGMALRERMKQVTSGGKTLLLLVESLDTFLWSYDSQKAGSASVQQFDALLAEALQEPELCFFLITTVRSDLMGQLSKLPRLQALLEGQALRHTPSPLSDQELLEIVSAPTSMAGLTWQSGLMERVVDDGRSVRAIPALLGLLLKALWAAREGNVLTHSRYQMLGGLEGVLRSQANNALKALPESEAARARSFLLSLVSSSGALLTLSVEDAVDAAGGGTEGEKLLTALATAQVITIEAKSVRISSDGLLSSGSIIRTWLEVERENLKRRDELEVAAATWEAAGKPRGGLPAGEQLAYFRKASSHSKKADEFLAQANAHEKFAKRHKMWLLLVEIYTVLLMAALAGAIWKWYPRPHSGDGPPAATFTPVCALPFSGTRNSAIDDKCGIRGGGSDPALQVESSTKNNFCAATQRSPEPITYEKLISLQTQSANLPKSLPDRTPVQNLGEGQYVSYVAFIADAHYSDVAAGEAANCNIAGEAANDIHIVLMPNAKETDQCKSTTAEISPHYRPANWTPAILSALKQRPVRVSGQLFYDGAHLPCSGTSRPNPLRASVWEIHPVYSVEVCKMFDLKKCSSSADPADWISLDKFLSAGPG